MQHQTDIQTGTFQLRIMNTLTHFRWFQAVPAPPGLSTAEQIWYIDYSVVTPKQKRTGSYLWSGSCRRG